MYKISEHKEEIITHLIQNLIWMPITAVIPIFLALTKNILSNEFSSKNIFSSTNILILCSMAIIIISYSFIKKSTINKQEQNHDLLFSKFRANSMVAELSFENREKLTSKITYEMNVLSNISEIKRTITWTGSQYVGTTLSNENGNYSLVDSKRDFSPHEIKILLNSEKKNGDFVRFTTETNVLDTNHEMSPHYSFMVKYQIDELILHVVAPAHLLKNVKRAIYADVAKEIPIGEAYSLAGENIGNLVRYTYRIPNPTFLYNYFIEWEFTN